MARPLGWVELAAVLRLKIQKITVILLYMYTDTVLPWISAPWIWLQRLISHGNRGVTYTEMLSIDRSRPHLSNNGIYIQHTHRAWEKYSAKVGWVGALKRGNTVLVILLLNRRWCFGLILVNPRWTPWRRRHLSRPEIDRFFSETDVRGRVLFSSKIPK